MPAVELPGQALVEREPPDRRHLLRLEVLVRVHVAWRQRQRQPRAHRERVRPRCAHLQMLERVRGDPRTVTNPQCRDSRGCGVQMEAAAGLPAAVLELREKHARRLSGGGGAGGPRKKATVGVILDDSQLGLVSMVLPGGPAHKKLKKGVRVRGHAAGRHRQLCCGQSDRASRGWCAGDVILSLDGTSVTPQNLVPLLGGHTY